MPHAAVLPGILTCALLVPRHRHSLPPANSQLVLSPVTGPGACLPLVGAGGWVDVRLAAPIRPTAFTYEHIPASVAFDIRSAPRALALTGHLGPPPRDGGGGGSGGGGGGGGAGGGGVPLGGGEYDARGGRAVQTFALHTQPGQVFDHVRLAIASNHGHPDLTCVYRLRVHGVSAVAPPAPAAAEAAAEAAAGAAA